MSDERSIDAVNDAVPVPGTLLKGRLRRYRGAVSAVHRVADALIILAALAVAHRSSPADWTPATAMLGVTAVVLFNLFAEAKHLYRSWRMGTISEELWYTLEAWIGVVGPTLLIHLPRDAGLHSNEMVIQWLIVTPAILCGWRIAMRHALRLARARGINTRRLAVVGSSEFARHVADTMASHSWIGFRVVGLFEEQEGREAPPEWHVRSLDALVRLARVGGVDVIYIAHPPKGAEQRIERLLQRLGDSTISAYVVHDRRARDPNGGPLTEQGADPLPHLPLLHRWHVDIGGIEAISIYETPFLGSGGWLKRAEDILVACIALLLLAIPMLVISVGVKRSGPGPVLFKQRRYGLDGREIMVWKFRSMTQCEDGAVIRQATRQDPRVTPFGAFLRRTSLDELPQFINVLMGTMSVVGPRPHAVAHNEYYRGLVSGYMLRHKVKPGITGWAQVNGYRGETEAVEKMRRRVEFDLAYIRNWSLWLDIRIIVQTALHGLVHKNAY